MYVRIIISLTKKRTNIRLGVVIMILQRLWKNYCYVILLIIISIIFSFVYVFTMSESHIEQENQDFENQHIDYAVEWKSSMK